jgi:hypothetical protein
MDWREVVEHPSLKNMPFKEDYVIFFQPPIYPVGRPKDIGGN